MGGDWKKVEFKKRRSYEERRFFIRTSFGARGIKTRRRKTPSFSFIESSLGRGKEEGVERERSEKLGRS